MKTNSKNKNQKKNCYKINFKFKIWTSNLYNFQTTEAKCKLKFNKESFLFCNKVIHFINLKIIIF